MLENPINPLGTEYSAFRRNNPIDQDTIFFCKTLIYTRSRKIFVKNSRPQRVNWTRTKDSEVERKGWKGLKKVYASLNVKWISTMRWSLRDVNWNRTSLLHSLCSFLCIYICTYVYIKAWHAREIIGTSRFCFIVKRCRSVLFDIATTSGNTLRLVTIFLESANPAWERN